MTAEAPTIECEVAPVLTSHSAAGHYIAYKMGEAAVIVGDQVESVCGCTVIMGTLDAASAAIIAPFQAAGWLYTGVVIQEADFIELGSLAVGITSRMRLRCTPQRPYFNEREATSHDTVH